MSAAIIPMVPMTCTICGGDNTRPETVSCIYACTTCMRALMCIRNGMPTEVSPELMAALAAQERK